MAGSGRENADVALLVALVAGATVADAASRAGVGERTVFRRLDDPNFRGELSTLRRRLLDDAVAEMTDATVDAARTLRALTGPNEAASVRLGAARAVIELGIRLREHAELEARVDAVETVLMTRARR